MMAVGIKIESTVEFIVEDSPEGRQLLNSLSRKGYRVTTPYRTEGIDSSDRYNVVRTTTPNKARKLTSMLAKQPGVETIMGVFDPVRLSRR